MKRILFVLPYYKLGGTLTSFSNLIPLINSKRYEINAFALTNDIDDVSMLPTGVNYIGISVKKTSQARLKNAVLKVMKWGKSIMVKLGFDPTDIIFKKMAKKLSGKYDIVIAFQEGQATRMAQHIDAPEKIAWIHCMYSRFKSCNKPNVINVYNNFEKIVCVSNTAAIDMMNNEPRWKGKIHVVYNATNIDKINTMAHDGVTYKKKINLISIGRIDPVKRFSYIPEIASKLKNQGIDFDWWVIGGPAVREEYDKLLKNISLYNVEDCVHLLGAISNPYPYIKSSTMLISLSLSETFNYTIAEAKALGIPVVSTNYTSSFEFIEHEHTGLILPIEEIMDGITRLLKDEQLYSHIQCNLYSDHGTTRIITSQLASLLTNE